MWTCRQVARMVQFRSLPTAVRSGKARRTHICGMESVQQESSGGRFAVVRDVERRCLNNSPGRHQPAHLCPRFSWDCMSRRKRSQRPIGAPLTAIDAAGNQKVTAVRHPPAGPVGPLCWRERLVLCCGCKAHDGVQLRNDAGAIGGNSNLHIPIRRHDFAQSATGAGAATVRSTTGGVAVVFSSSRSAAGATVHFRTSLLSDGAATHRGPTQVDPKQHRGNHETVHRKPL